MTKQVPGQSSTNAFTDMVERSYQMVRQVRQRYGMSRLELGLLLDTVQEQQLWKGKADSFWEYVDDLRLNRNACRSYMNVARKFIVELGVSDVMLAQLAGCNMAVLDKAANVMTVDNVEEVINAVLALHQRDALTALKEIDPLTDHRSKGSDAAKLFGRYMQLPDDARIEFLNRVRPRMH